MPGGLRRRTGARVGSRSAESRSPEVRGRWASKRGASAGTSSAPAAEKGCLRFRDHPSQVQRPRPPQRRTSRAGTPAQDSHPVWDLGDTNTPIPEVAATQGDSGAKPTEGRGRHSRWVLGWSRSVAGILDGGRAQAAAPRTPSSAPRGQIAGSPAPGALEPGLGRARAGPQRRGGAAAGTAVAAGAGRRLEAGARRRGAGPACYSRRHLPAGRDQSEAPGGAGRGRAIAAALVRGLEGRFLPAHQGAARAGRGGARGEEEEGWRLAPLARLSSAAQCSAGRRPGPPGGPRLLPALK